MVDSRTDRSEASPVRDYTLICRSENQPQVGWHLPEQKLVSESSSSTGDFRQTRTGSTATFSVSRLSTNSEDVS